MKTQFDKALRRAVRQGRQSDIAILEGKRKVAALRAVNDTKYDYYHTPSAMYSALRNAKLIKES